MDRKPSIAGLKAPTVTLKNLAAQIAEKHNLSKKQSEQMLGEFVEMTVKHLKNGERVRIGGLGILQVRKRAARLGRNPATGEQIEIKPSKKVAFRAAKELKAALDEEAELVEDVAMVAEAPADEEDGGSTNW